MSDSLQRVVLTGRTLRGKSEHAVAEGLGPVLGQEPAFAATLLGHGEITLHRELSLPAAQHYVAALQSIGADARYEPAVGAMDAPPPAHHGDPELAPLRVADRVSTLQPSRPVVPGSRPGIAGWWLAATVVVIVAGRVSAGLGILAVMLAVAVASVATRKREDGVTTALAALTGLIVLLLVLLFTRALGHAR